MVSSDGFAGDGLKKLFGVISEEIDTLYPQDANEIRLWNGQTVKVHDYAEILRVKEDVHILGQYTQDFYQSVPAVTEHAWGDGTAYYVAARMESEGNRQVLERMLSRSGLVLPKLPEGVEYHVREAEDVSYAFLLNLEEQEKQIGKISGLDLLTGKSYNGSVQLEPYGAAVIKVDRKGGFYD